MGQAATRKAIAKKTAICWLVTTLGVLLLLAGCAQSGRNDGTSTSTSPGDGGRVDQATEQFGELTQARYSRSGDSLGNMYYIETDVDDDGTPIVRVAESPQHDVRATIGEYRMPDGLLERISAIVDKAGMKTWGDLPMSDMVPLDAATPSITLVFASADPDDAFPVRLSFTAWDEFPEGGEKAFDAIRDELSASIKQENQIRTYTEPEREA